MPVFSSCCYFDLLLYRLEVIYPTFILDLIFCILEKFILKVIDFSFKIRCLIQSP